MTFKIKTATGKMFKCNDDSPSSPELEGSISFAPTDLRNGHLLELPGKAWIQIRAGKIRYSLDFGELTGYLVPVSVMCDGDPDYVGALGPNEELVVEGRRRTDVDGKQFIELHVHDPVEGVFVLSAAQNPAHFI